MTKVPTGKPGDRARRIEMVAAIVFGSDPNDRAKPLPGWQGKLSQAMGMGRTAVNDTLGLAYSERFDKRLAEFIAGHRFQMIEDLHTLDILRFYFDDHLQPDIMPEEDDDND